MTEFQLRFKESIRKDLRRIGRKASIHIIRKIRESLLPNPAVGKQLKGKGRMLWSWRTGNYRIIYTFNNQNLILLVIRISHRKDVYRNLPSLSPVDKKTITG
ncbi:MAG: hypothetical protein DRJ08_01570 [Acidobacteria bacterium]|nr:MAG: hypothetical protein DRJ14_02375 [Acidobacteriota bacterium]RLE24039.1 MAG: hypothetical protein DRJ08_01570 [Acidobacteriota bacterium]